jgi:hypothetical protein
MEYQSKAKLFTMKYYRFSRRRNDYFRYFRSKKKSDYMILTGRSKILDSGSFDNQVWGALILFDKRFPIFIVAVLAANLELACVNTELVILCIAIYYLQIIIFSKAIYNIFLLCFSRWEVIYLILNKSKPTII